MVPTSILKRAREEAGVKQAEMGARLGVSGSVISRLEKSEHTDDTMAKRYLEALSTDTSRAIVEFYSRDWRISVRPSFHHPQFEDLWSAESALQRLEQFEHSEEYDALLAAPLSLVRSSLEAATDFIAGVEHSIAWIGTVGVGKTTALSLLTGLVVPDKTGRPQPVFPASGGRTTTSEVIIRAAPAYGIAVEPMSDDNVRLLVTEMVSAVATSNGGISTELDRAIRNMADLGKRRSADDPRTLADPVRDLLADDTEQQDVVDEIVNRMRLDQRTETQMIMSETAAEGLHWLAENIANINFGRHPRFSVPQRVTVFVPASAMRKTRYELSIVDTKGIHGTTERADIQAFTSDARTLSILCCSFNDAPGTDPLKLLKSLQAGGSDAIDKQRVMLLVLPRADEALKVIDASGEPVESIEMGYAIRAGQIEDSLAEANLPQVPIAFFNAVADGPSGGWEGIAERIDAMRLRQLERLHRFVTLADDLITNADAARIQQARTTIADEAHSIVKAYPAVEGMVRPAHQRLIEELDAGHPSSIAASIARRGGWENFDVHHMIGVGVRVDANRRTNTLFTKIRGRLEALRDKFAALPEIVGLIETLLEDVSDWQQEFLARSLSVGRNAFKPYLDRSEDLWANLRARYGGGSGYRHDVAEMVKEWFDETPELVEARRRVDARLTDAWRELVLDRLIASTALTEAEEQAAG